jgi:ATP-binding cassette subfamily F protein uup
VGLIGPNGSGKSTLLRILAGQDRPDSGTVAPRRGLHLGFLPQEDELPPDETVRRVLEAALAGRGLEPYERDTQVEIALNKGGFTDPTQPVKVLSGGWRKRLALARALLREPDLLLLDEPTNHLDLNGILWMESFLQNAPFAFLMVSHDRYFLENTCARIIELNRVYEDGCFSVDGPYSEFLLRRAEYLSARAHQEQALAVQVRREVEWLQRGARARTTKSVHRIRTAGQMIEDLSELRSRNAAEKSAIDIDFSATGRRTKQLLAAVNVEKRMGDRMLFRRMSFVLSPKSRLGLMGVNGSGKTTLIRVLTGELEPDAGRVRRADGLRVILFDQHREQLDPEQTLKEALAGEKDSVEYRGRPVHVSGWARRFLFATEQLVMPVKSLSGGEQARILIARLMLQEADVLILDEPTNDLDIPSLEVLEESLSDFPGALVLVTHDRFMMDRLCTDLLALDGRGAHGFFADYAQWEQWSLEQQAQPVKKQPAPARPEATTVPDVGDGPAKLTVREQRELDRMEKAILAAEKAVQDLTAAMQDPGALADHVKLRECSEGLQAAQDRVDQLYARWEELETRRQQSG